METTGSNQNSNSEIELRKYQPWGDVTDPSKHNPDKFRYLVYAIQSMARVHMTMLDLQNRRDKPTQKGQGVDPGINLYNQPERLTERVALSMSLIDQDHTDTWGRAGLIVEAPPENIRVASPHDSGVHTFDKEMIEWQAQRTPALAPDELLLQTDPKSYNEVVALANNEGRKLRLAGFFYKVADDGLLLDEDLAQRMIAHAKRLGLPAVPISEQNPYAENKIESSDNRLTVYFQGEKYYIKGRKETDFRRLDQRDFVTFISPEELNLLIQFLINNGYSQEEINQLMADYKATDKERQKPKIYYDEKGNVKQIDKRQGYGEDEEILSVWGTGSTNRENSVNRQREMKKIYANFSGGIIKKRPETIFSPKEVEDIIQETIDNVSDEEKTKIRAWYESIKENVAKQVNEIKQEGSGFYKGGITSFKMFKE